MADEEKRGIYPLNDLSGYKVADGYPDVDGWDVIASDGTKIGEVDDLLVDTVAMRVRYLDVDLDDDATGRDDHVLVPIGAAQLDDDDDNVMLSGITLAQIRTLPAYNGGPVSRDFEMQLGRTFGAGATAGAATGAGSDFYSQQQFDDSRFYGKRRDANADRERHLTRSEEELAIGKRRVEAGEVDIRKTVETEHVRQPVTRKREEVEIERRPVEGGRSASSANLGQDEIRVPITEEEVVVEKRPVVKEELVVRKREVEDTEEVEADLRKERIEVDRPDRTTTGRTDRDRDADRRT
jgi:photosynthetic reaction center H subunit